MSSKIALLSLISYVLAVPYGVQPRYPAGNATLSMPIGTGVQPTTTLQSTVVNTATTVITNYLTLTRPVSGSPGEASGAPIPTDDVDEADVSGSICGRTVTSTISEKITVYVTAGAADVPSSAPPAQAPSSIAPVEDGYEAVPSPSFELVSTLATAPSSTEVAAEVPAAETPIAEAPATETPVVEAPAVSSIAEAPISSTAPESNPQPSSVEEPASYPSSTTNKSGKRGLAYNDASLTTCFEDKQKVTWAYNWAQKPDGLSSAFEFVPLLWGTRADFTTNWAATAKQAIADGTTHVMGFNEPDHEGQANMSPAAAADAWRTYLEPLAGSVKLGAPGVTNGGDAMGLTWLGNFLKECSDCTIDFCPVHWYDSAENVSYFKKHLTEAKEVCGGKPIWLTEFAATGSDDQVTAFLEEVLAWMDDQDFIERYAYFMVKSGSGMLLSGTEESKIGATYASA